MSSSVFEPVPEHFQEPLALRRQRALAYPGGATALAARAAVLDRTSHLRTRRFAQSPVGVRSSRILDGLHNSQKGATGVVVCNGPSINQTDLELVGQLPYILMNRGYLLGKRLAGNPAALCVSADLVLEQYGDEIAAMDAPLLLDARQQHLIERRDGVAFVERERQWRFASRIGSSLHMGYTVTYWALQLAFHLGWDRCLIVGMDHKYDQTGDPTVTVKTEGADRNHFDPNYFEHGSRWLLPALEMNEYSYRLVRAAYESHGREVIDCTVGGACRVFERRSLSDLVAD